MTWCKAVLSYAYDKNKPNKEDADIFKKFIQRIIEAENREDAMQNVFYGNDGIDIAFQREKISWKEHQMLLAIIEKMA